MEIPTLPTNKRRLKHVLTTLALFTALAAIPAYVQTSSGVTNSQPPIPPSWSILEDSDQDGMKDADELLMGMDPLDPADGLSDLDGDGIDLAWEFAIGSNPDVADTDMDGWSDSEEYLLYGTDPLDALSFPLGDTPTSGGSTGMETTPVPEAAPPPPPPPPSLSNGDFSDVGITTWKSMLNSTEYQGGGFKWNAGAITSWTAYVGTTMEVWDAGGEKFVELDGSPGNYGIKQQIANAKAGGYVLAWRQSGRNSTRADSDPYRVKVYYLNGTTEVPIAQSDEFSGFDKLHWTDNALGFQITPEQLKSANGIIYVAFIPTGKLDTYGTLIDKVSLMTVEVVELSPKVKDENGNDIAGSEKPNSGKPLTPFVEVNPYANKIAHRELKVRIGELLKGKTVTWTLEPLPGATPATIRGAWTNSTTHPNRFEASATYGANGFTSLSQASCKTTVANDGFTAIRVNVPPIGFNQARIKIQVEGTTASIDLIDMEVPGVVVIDPGHGGTANSNGSSYNNAESPSGVLEKTMTLDYGLALRTALRAKRQQDKLNLRVFMTREVDENPSGAARAHVARDNGADVFFVLHYNSDDDTGTKTHPRVPHRSRGTLEVYRTTNNVSPQEDTDLSNNLIDCMVTAMTPFDTEANHRARVPYGGDGVNGPAVSSDLHNGNSTNYHPIRTAYIEGEFIDFGANTAADRTDDLVDILLNTGTNAATVKTAIVNSLGDGIIQNIQNQP